MPRIAAPSVAVAPIHLPATEDEGFAIDEPVPLDELSGYEISGLPFNMPKIAARRTSLFPFLTAKLEFLDRIPAHVREASRHLGNPLESAAGSSALPLTLSAPVLQRLVDESWTRRDRWRRFATIAELLEQHHAQQGQAADLVRAYIDQNLLQPYCDGKTRDGQFWALLENASDHVDFLEFIRAYVRSHPASRTTTELLFLMDELTQASREAAVGVLTIDVSKELLHTAVASPPAARLAADLAVQVREVLASQGMTPFDVGEAFDRVRLRALATIIDTSPGHYRVADARYLAGEIFFRQGDVDQAITWWREIRAASTDSYATRAMADAARAGDLHAMKRVLATERARWAAINYARLRQFGYRCDTY